MSVTGRLVAVRQVVKARPHAVQQKLQELAGTGATDCGRVKSQDSSVVQPASDCAMKAAEGKQAFYVAYDLPGLTTAVARATSRADELSKEEFDNALDAFKAKITESQPQYIAFLGKAAYKAFSKKKEILWGLQAEDFCGAKVWVLPNTSGLNRGFSLDQLVAYYKEFYHTIHEL